MTHKEKAQHWIEECRTNSIGTWAAAPPAWHLLWKLGFKVPPPHFIPIQKYGLGLALILFAITWVTVAIMVDIWAANFVAPSTILLAFPFIIWLHWRQMKRLNLPPWETYCEGSTSVAIVIDPNFGDRLIPLSKRIHVWACDSNANKAISEKIWAAGDLNGKPNAYDLTTFKFDRDASPEQIFLETLLDINGHHSSYSHNKGWKALEVYGTDLTPAIQSALIQDYACETFTKTSTGFIAKRTT